MTHQRSFIGSTIEFAQRTQWCITAFGPRGDHQRWAADIGAGMGWDTNLWQGIWQYEFVFVQEEDAIMFDLAWNY